MEVVAKVLMSNNLIPLSVVVIILILLLAFLSRKGFFSFKMKGLVIGNDENERRILRLQIEYTKAELDTFFEAIINECIKNPEFVEWRCRFSKELVFDIFIEAIALNHITVDDFYTNGKIIKIWAELARLHLSEKFRSEEFKEKCAKEVKKIFKNLVAIRTYYTKGGN